MRVAVFLAAAIAASVAASERVTMGTRTFVPSGWKEEGATPADARLSLTFVVKEKNVARLFEIVDSVSDPASPQFGQVTSSL